MTTKEPKPAKESNLRARWPDDEYRLEVVEALNFLLLKGVPVRESLKECDDFYDERMRAEQHDVGLGWEEYLS